jgi:hypothetical protein
MMVYMVLALVIGIVALLLIVWMLAGEVSRLQVEVDRLSAEDARMMRNGNTAILFVRGAIIPDIRVPARFHQGAPALAEALINLN